MHKHTRKFYLLSVLVLFCLLSSCTYDYFEDETNYVVYVPKADVNVRTETYKVDDVRIFIYNTGLEKERYSLYPFEDNARTRVGNFHFKLLPGTHPVYCFSNVKDVDFLETQSYNTAKFVLPKSDDGYYKEPPLILSEYLEPHIRIPGPLVMDTALFENKYVGRICVAIKNLEAFNSKLILNNIKTVEILASGIGTTQYLSQITDSITTRSSRSSLNDKMKFNAKLYSKPYKDFEFGFENYYFPSPDLTTEGNASEPINLKLSFLDSNNDLIDYITVEVRDDNYQPKVLHMAETLVVTIDGKDVKILTLKDLIDWDATIETGKDTTPDGGGTEV